MGSAAPPAGVFSFGSVIRSREVARSVFSVELEITDLKGGRSRPLPGQFYQVKCADGPEHMLRRPISVHSLPEWSDRRHVLELLVENVGWGTHILCSLQEGDGISLLGPLGNGFTVAGNGGSLLVAGGMGIAPLAFLAREIAEAGKDFRMVCGFKSAENVDAGTVNSIGGIEVCTEDGTMGTRGTACDLLSRYLKEGSHRAIFTCGPEAMMAAVSDMAEKLGIPCQVSLVSRMACGIGVCRGCVRRSRDGGNLCVCKEGPVFDSKQVEWKIRNNNS